MPLIPAQHVDAKDVVSLRLRRRLHEQLKLYAEFIQSPKDYVVSQALTRLFRNDREFAIWLESRTDVIREPTPLEISTSKTA